MSNVVWNTGLLKGIFDSERAAWISMTCPADKHGTEFLLQPEEFHEYDRADAAWLGNLKLCIRLRDEEISTLYTASWKKEVKIQKDCGKILVNYYASKDTYGLGIIQEYLLTEKGILWNILLTNTGQESITIQRLGVPLFMNQYFRGNDDFKYQQCVLRHSCVCHENSWFYWAKSSGDGPLLVLKTMEQTALDSFDVGGEDSIWDSRGTMHEAFEGLYTVYPIDEPSEKFPLCEGEKMLKSGENFRVSFMLSMVENYESLKEWLALNDGFYLESNPGMVIPVGKKATLTLKCGECPAICSLNNEDFIGKCEKTGKDSWCAEIVLKGYGHRIYEIKINGKVSRIIFWGIEEQEEIYKQQAAFIKEKQWETDNQDPCYHGLLMWDMDLKHRINSRCNPYGPDWFAGGSDEIGLVSGLFLSEWNVYRPNTEQIQVLQAYCKDFIEDRLTEQPGWKVHRMVPWFTMFDGWKGKGADDIWRAFNYVHIVNTYYNMYRIASLYDFPWLEKKEIWIKKAYFYAKAMFSYWMFPNGEGAKKYGNMGEAVLALLLEKALLAEHMDQEAAEISKIVRKKADYFSKREFPYGSEMAYDSTAFEAVYAYGKAVGDYRVMEGAMKAVLANRGKQPVWYLYMTDLRANGDSSWNVSYMTQLGAFALYDWVLEEKHYSPELAKALYASYLAGFSIFNSGGYLSGEPENKGASAWIMTGKKGLWSGREGEPYRKGYVAMSGESALGYYGALRIASSMILEEKEKLVPLGCTVEENENGYQAFPEDGLRCRFFDLKQDFAIKLERDAIKAVVFCNGSWEIFLENITKDKHICSIWFRLHPKVPYNICGTEKMSRIEGESSGEWERYDVEISNLVNKLEIKVK